MKKLNSKTVNSFLDFKTEIKKYLNKTTSDFDLEIGIPKFSVHTPIKVKGLYNDYSFNGTIKEICKWYEFESHYKKISDFYEDINDLKYDKLSISLLFELTEKGKVNIDFPTEGYDLSKLKWSKDTPEEIIFDLEEEEDFEEFCELYDRGNQTEPKIVLLKIKFICLEDNKPYEIIWKND